jgi:threonine dehydrogenase-like Zn-dependent dehydrogenase
MHALCWNGKNDIRFESVPDPVILNPQDAIVRVTLTAICGSDLHLYDGDVPAMKRGDILGHEFMGEVVEVGPGVQGLGIGDRVVVPFTIACGRCEFCTEGLWSLCDNSNPNAGIAEKLYGYSPAGQFGSSHLMGGYAGGQAEYVRVPFADVGPLRVPPEVSDERALFLSDVFPTGYMAAESCGIRNGDTVAVWGCGPVGQFAIQSAYLLGAERVIALDPIPERLLLAQSWGQAEVIDCEQTDALAALREMTGGRGPDACIDAVGMEAHGGVPVDAAYDLAQQKLHLETDCPHVLGQAIQACRKGGAVSIPGVYRGLLDRVPLGTAFGKGLTLKLGQTHVHGYLRPLLDLVAQDRIDPSQIITHRLPLEEGPVAYETFKRKRDGCIKVVLNPDGRGAGQGNGRPQATAWH